MKKTMQEVVSKNRLNILAIVILGMGLLLLGVYSTPGITNTKVVVMLVLGGITIIFIICYFTLRLRYQKKSKA